MSYRTVFITHVELSSNFIKIHGQMNRETATRIEFAMPTIKNLFRNSPPSLNMLDKQSVILVYHDSNYYRGKFIGSGTDRTINVSLIDTGRVVTVELANIRELSVSQKVAECIVSEPPQANEFILNKCIIRHDSYLRDIKDEILFNDVPYNIDKEIGNIKLISLNWRGRNYADYLIGRNKCYPLNPEQQYNLNQMQRSAPYPSPMTKSSFNTVQMIHTHLAGNNRVPNMPSYHPRVSPSIDYNSNHSAAIQSQVGVSNKRDEMTSHYIPTFISDTLLIGGRHEVYISDVEDGPYMFSVQLKSSNQRMHQMMADIAECQLKPLSRKPTLGMACLARYSEDNNLYRAVIKSISDTYQLLFIDYGNSEKVRPNNIYDIPEQFLRPKTFAVRVKLYGLNSLPPLSERVKTFFKDVVDDKVLDMVVVRPDGTSIDQYCELSLNGESILNRLKDFVNETQKFIEPTPLKDDDFVVIRYVESPKLFCVQKTKNIVEYDELLDKLFEYCTTAPLLKKIEIGVACAARFKNDEEWYRAEIVNVNGKSVFIKFVDYGIVHETDADKLKEISYDFFMMPKQAVACCLLGFDAVQTPSSTSQDQMELLAEDACRGRRNFRVKIHGVIDDTMLVNLTDESQMPHLDLSMKMLQLSLPQRTFREIQMQNKTPTTRQINEVVNPNASANGKTLSDSGFQDGAASTSTSVSNWDTSDIKSPRRPEFAVEPKDSKFYKNKHYVNPAYDSYENRNARNAALNTGSNARREHLSPEGGIDANTQIPIPEIPINKTLEVKLTWCFSPLEFYVSTIESDADLEYTMQMKNIHHFYKNKSPVTKRVEIGSFVITKYSKNNQFHRAKIIDYNEKFNKYKAQLIDLGALTIVDACDIYEMDKRFAKLDCFAIPCSLRGAALRASRFDIESCVEKYMGNKTLLCTFTKRKGDVFYVDIEADGRNLREALIRDNYISVLSEDIEIERLIGQTVMAKIVSVKDSNSFQLVLSGCETIFEASCKDFISSESKKLPTQVTIPVRIDSLLIGKTFAVTPLIYETSPPSPICRMPFFSNNFQVVVVHWESYNVAYVQSVNAEKLAQALLDELFEYYSSNGATLQQFIPYTLCAVKSSDENWYRAEILSVTSSEVNVRYLDYGNCELIPKNLVKRLESQFLDTAALAVRVYLPLKKTYTDKGKAAVDEIAKSTSEIALDLTVLAYHADNWIVDMFNNGTSITSVIKTKSSCMTMSLDELKKQIVDIEAIKKATSLQNKGIAPVVTPISVHPVVQVAQPVTKQISQPLTEQITQPLTEQITQPLAKQITQPEPVTPTKAQQVIQPVTHLVNQPSSQVGQPSQITRTKAYISHIDRPDRFYLQIASMIDELDRLQENIQIVAPLLPPLQDFSTDTRCIVRYSVDDQWYRAVIIDSDTRITSILFMDYGNTDTITDNSLIKTMEGAFDHIQPHAIPCALPLEAKDRNEWSEESCELLKNLVDEVEFEFVCKGKCNNFVKLYHGERDIMQELIQSGYAIKLDTIRSGENCYISHINSISDFYIQMESDCNALEKVSDYLLDESKFNAMTDIKEGVVCAAKYMDDGLWYRGKIKSHSAGNTEVFFIDYGNSSLTNDLRIIPAEIANAPSLAKYCSLVKPKDVQYWSENAEQRFVEVTDNGTIFKVDVISPGKKSTVDLLVNEKSILEEISNLCDKYSLSALENTLQSNTDAPVASEIFKATIVGGSPDQFYIQLDCNSTQLDQLWVALESASQWPALEEVVIGQICAAIFEGSYYRAKIESLSDEGATVHFVDYGNKSISTDLRTLPENLQNIQHLAILCSLESKNGAFSPQLIQRFEKLSINDPYEMKYVSKASNPPVIQLFENGVLFADNPTEVPSLCETNSVDTEITKTCDTNSSVVSEIFKATIVEGSPDRFYIQLESTVSQLDELWVSLEEAFTWAALEQYVVGEMCAAHFEGHYYRAKIESFSDGGATVHYVDYGNKSFSTDVRKLPDNLKMIPHLAILCSLESKNGVFSPQLIERFENLSREILYEMKYVSKTSDPHVVQIFENGVEFADIPTEVVSLCEKNSSDKEDTVKQCDTNINAVPELFKATIVDGSPDRFYIQLENTSTQLDELWVSLESASNWPVLDQIVVGQMCAALFEESFYRAKIVSHNDEGTTVHYVDYGNKSISSDLRELPENLQSIPPLAILCSLESKNGIFSPQLIQRFENLSKDDLHEMKVVSRTSNPPVVQLFKNGVLFAEETEIPESEEIFTAKQSTNIKAYISERISPSHFYIQLNDEMDEAMATASDFPLLEDSDKRAGKLCAALWEGAFYRAQILSVDEQGIKVHFIDYGNDSYVTDLRKLPHDVEQIERASMLCSLENIGEHWSSDFLNRFTGLNLDNQYEFEIVERSSPCVVRLYIDGKLFSDATELYSNLPKNGHTEAESDSISIVNGIIDKTIQKADQREFANEIVSDVIDSSLNGTDNSSTITDGCTEADRISKEHFESIRKMGLDAPIV